MPELIKLDASPVQQIVFRNRSFFIKRDDLLHPQFSGNKARKFYDLLHYDFSGVDKIIGYGSAQANSLYSLAALAQLKRLPLDFYVDHISDRVKQNNAGNYGGALALGANIISCGSLLGDRTLEHYVEETIAEQNPGAMVIPEGGRSLVAEPGVKLLAEEITSWAYQQGINQLEVMLPSGTGTTALLLQKHSPFKVLTCACVGGDDYLQYQFSQLSNDVECFPQILPPEKKYHFGKLYKEFYDIWYELKQVTGITFELLYDPLGWLTLLRYLENNRSSIPVLYIHQGGLLGNETMLPRYQWRKMTNKSRF